MSRDKESLVRFIEMIGAGSWLAGMFQDHAVLGIFTSVVSLVIIHFINKGDQS